MNKTVTANISGIVFHIEAEAYEKLHKYLNTIRNYFHDSDGKDEIMDDIESRIAELFKESLTNGKDVITMAEVKRVVEIMGEPEQYMDESASEDYSYQEGNSQSNSHSQSNSQKFRTKKLYRDEDDKVLGGICAGLGHYFGIDRIWIRILFLIGVFAGFGFGIVIYLILWAIIPKAITTAEKLEMKGEPINVENIGNTIKDEFNSFKKKVNSDSTSDYGRQAGDAIGKFFELIGRVLTFILKFIIKVIGIFLIIGPAIGIIAIFTIMIGSPGDIQINHDLFGGYWNQEFAEIYVENASTFITGFIGIGLITLIPLFALFYSGLKILFKIPSSNKIVAITASALFTLGVILSIYTASSTAAQYSSKQNITEFIELEELVSDTIILKSLEDHYSTSFNRGYEIFIENDFIFTDNISVNVTKTYEELVRMKIHKTSRGRGRKDAGSRAENINFTYEVSNNKLEISPYIDFPYDDKFRNQEIEISIELPVGKSIFLENSSTDIIYDIKNKTNTYDGKMIGHTWRMTKKGLECTDCSWIKLVDDVDEEDEEDESNY